MVGVSPKCTSQYPRVGPAIPAPDIKTFTGIGDARILSRIAEDDARSHSDTLFRFHRVARTTVSVCRSGSLLQLREHLLRQVFLDSLHLVR
jgi:hypothetical protein